MIRWDPRGLIRASGEEEFGRNQIVPIAVLSGVFKVANLAQAPIEGLTLFCARDLGAMRHFIETTG